MSYAEWLADKVMEIALDRCGMAFNQDETQLIRKLEKSEIIEIMAKEKKEKRR